MATAQPDKTGMHILLKLASTVIILAGIHAAADIIVQLLLALFFAIVLNPLVTVYSSGREATAGDYYRGGRHADRAYRAGGCACRIA